MNGKVQIEQTAKTYKLQYALAFLLILVGIVSSANENVNLGVPCLLIGIIWFLGARLAAWWNHG